MSTVDLHPFARPHLILSRADVEQIRHEQRRIALRVTVLHVLNEQDLDLTDAIEDVLGDVARAAQQIAQVLDYAKKAVA